MAHNENFVAWPSKNISRNQYYNYINSIFLTPKTKAFIEECKLDKRILYPGFDDKFRCTRTTNGLTYYRRMSRAEYASFATAKYKTKPLASACDYVGTKLYRVWVSSSYRKCKVFGNENVADPSDDVVVRLRFKKAVLSLALDFQPHQVSGVQTDETMVAVHREGFATYGNLDADEFAFVKAHNLDHNIGFCGAKLDKLHDELAGFEVMP